MSEKGLPTSSSQQTSVFSVFRGIGDRYSQFEEDSLMSTSPPAHDNFPEPIKFKPRKSKFHTLHQEDPKSTPDGSSKSAGPDVIIPKLIISNKPTKISGEVFKKQFTAKFDNQRIGLDSSSPHGSIETEPSSSAVVKLFEQTQRGNQSSQIDPISKMVRRASDTNLFQRMAVMPERNDSNALVKSSNTSLAVREESVARKTESAFKGEVMKTNFPKDTVDSSQSTWSSFSGWLYGGKKVMNVDNRDMNALGPSSF